MPNGDTPHITNNHSTRFKTWIKDLTKIQGVVNNIKNIELWPNGATELLDQNIVNNLSSAINGLNLQQAQLALSTRKLTQDQMNQVLVQAGLIASEDRIQAELLQSALAQAGLSTEKQNAILSELELMNINTGEIYTTKACTKEELLNMLATKGVTGANEEAILSILGLSGANEKAALSFGLFTKATWSQTKAYIALMASNPISLIFAIIDAFSLVSKATAKFSEENEKLDKKIEKASENFSNTSSKLEEINNKLKENKERIEEINQLENPTYIDGKI